MFGAVLLIVNTERKMPFRLEMVFIAVHCYVHVSSTFNYQPLGMENGIIHDYQITADCSYNSLAPSARLNSDSTWTACISTQESWIQVTFEEHVVIGGVITQGSPKADEWVTQFWVWCASINSNRMTVWSNKTFVRDGNTDSNTAVTNFLLPAAIAFIIRIIPVQYHGARASLRFEILGNEIEEIDPILNATNSPTTSEVTSQTDLARTLIEHIVNGTTTLNGIRRNEISTQQPATSKQVSRPISLGAGTANNNLKIIIIGVSCVLCIALLGIVTLGIYWCMRRQTHQIQSGLRPRGDGNFRRQDGPDSENVVALATPYYSLPGDVANNGHVVYHTIDIQSDDPHRNYVYFLIDSHHDNDAMPSLTHTESHDCNPRPGDNVYTAVDGVVADTGFYSAVSEEGVYNFPGRQSTLIESATFTNNQEGWVDNHIYNVVVD